MKYTTETSQRTIEQHDAVAERECLILEHLSQVRLIAWRIHDRMPEKISLEDLISAGIVGLISAIDNFDPSLNVKLRTYTGYKIRWAILDSLRELDWLSREKRQKVKQIGLAATVAGQRLHRTPIEEEVAQELNLTIEEYHQWLVEIQGVNLGSLEYTSSEGTDDLLKHVSDSEEKWPSRILERTELKKLLAEAIETIPPIERRVLRLYYSKELKLRKIGKLLHLTESRISQLKMKAILRLRCYIKKRWPTQRGI